jgi:hypothetical protein
MNRKCLRLVLAGVTAGAITSATLLAGAWELWAPLEIRVNNHEFYQMRVWNEECTINVKLRFRAPAAAYRSGADERNHYRFKARVQLSDNIALDSPLFFNRKPGARRYYTFRQHTHEQGCWAKKKHQVYWVDVRGCRGTWCSTEPLRPAD